MGSYDDGCRIIYTMPPHRHANEWLSLIEVSGPFLTMPVLESDAMRRRLGEIPGEIEDETEAIRAWFADPQLIDRLCGGCRESLSDIGIVSLLHEDLGRVAATGPP